MQILQTAQLQECCGLPAAHSVRSSRFRTQGTALDWLPDPPLRLENCLFDRAALQQLDAPAQGSADYRRICQIDRLWARSTATLRVNDADSALDTARQAIAQLAQSVREDVADRKLPRRVREDPSDPTVIYIEAVRLAHIALHEGPCGSAGADVDGLAFVLERLSKAEQLRRHPDDARFDLLLSLAAFLSAVLGKLEHA